MEHTFINFMSYSFTGNEVFSLTKFILQNFKGKVYRNYLKLKYQYGKILPKAIFHMCTILTI